MKELSIEEKAKAYDEALERAKKWRNAPNIDKIPTFGNRVIEEIFPELRESEEERTRNEIIAFVEQSIHRGGGTPIPQEQEDKWIAWLEKQAEVESDDDIEAEEKDIRKSFNKIWEEKQGEQKPTDNDMVEALRTEYEKGRADAFATVF